MSIAIIIDAIFTIGFFFCYWSTFTAEGIAVEVLAVGETVIVIVRAVAAKVGGVLVAITVAVTIAVTITVAIAVAITVAVAIAVAVAVAVSVGVAVTVGRVRAALDEGEARQSEENC